MDRRRICTVRFFRLDRTRNDRTDLPHGLQVNFERREVALQLAAQALELPARAVLARFRAERADRPAEFQYRVALAVIELGKVDGAVLLQRRGLKIDQAFDPLDGLRKRLAQRLKARRVRRGRVARSSPAV